MRLNQETVQNEKASIVSEDNLYIFGQDQHAEFSPKTIFYEFKEKVYNNYNIDNFNIKGRLKTLYPQLEKYGISTFEEFEKECALIMIKKSEKPSSVRKLIMQLYRIIKFKYNEKIRDL